MLTSLIIIVVVIALAALGTLLISKQYKKVGPNEVLIISGGRKRSITLPDGTKKEVGYRIHIGGGTLVLPFVESYQILPLESISLEFEVPDIISGNGVKCIVSVTAQVKVDGTEPAVHLAAEQFLGKTTGDIREVAVKIIEGHLRAIIGTMPLEALNKDRKNFAAAMFTETTNEFGHMGLKMIAFNLKDIKDPQGYLEALGKPQIAEAKRKAEVAEAETSRDTIIKSASAKKEGDIAKLIAETEVSRATRDFETQQALYQADINRQRALADFSYDLEKQKINQQIIEEEYKVKIIEKEQSIQVENREVARREKELEATVKKPAAAEKYRLEMEAQGMAEAKRLQGLVEAEIVKSLGKAEAEAMEEKAESWSQYNQAAILEMFFKTLPELAREVAQPLSKVDKIVMVNSGSEGGAAKLTGEVANVMAQLPTVVETLSGVNLKNLIENLPGMKKKEEKKEEPTKEKDAEKS